MVASLSSGGAERVIAMMANYWAAQGQTVTLVTLTADEQDFYTVDPRVNRVRLGLLGDSPTMLHGLMNNIHRIFVLRRSLRASAPDVVISFLDQMNILTLIAAWGTKVPLVVSERIDPSVRPLSALWRLLRILTYPLASRVVVQTERAGKYFGRLVRRRLAVIPNPVMSHPGTKTLRVPRPCVMGIGRLEHQKGFDMLLRAFSYVSHLHPEWSLVLIGDGSLRGELQDLSRTLKLGEKVHFPGRVDVNEPLLKQADIFVMSSRFEGFPNALCEAMAAGCATISFDCPSGPREIIVNGDDGILVPSEDVEALSVAMNRLMENEEERRRLAERATRVVLRFGVEEVMRMWARVIEKPTFR